MTPEHWEQVALLHRAALQRGEGQRAAFLHDACAGDEDLRCEVESLLTYEGEAENFMEVPALDVVVKRLAESKALRMVQRSGTKLGPYEILAPLGAGGMGEVYRAHDSKLNRDVALKILPAMFTNDAERMARFRREAQVLASLNHPNIGSIYGLEDWNNLRVLVLELVEGPTLADRIAGGAIPLEEMLAIARQIAEGVAYAHEKGVIHRDLKPANIKITPEGNVKVLDFGLAKVLEGPKNLDSDASQFPNYDNPTTLEGMILGTAAYMSPEQAKGKPVDKRADIWAFGVVLYELLTGRHLFQRETASDTLAAVLKEEPDWNQIPAKAQPLLRRCLEKDPKRRLRDIGDMHLLLETASVPVQTHRPWLARGAVAVFLVAFAALFWYLSRPLPPPHITEYTQITHDGRSKGLGGTDGTRLYFSYMSPASIAQVGVNGGEIVPLPITVPGAHSYMVDLSPDGSNALVRVYRADRSLWVVPILGGSARRMGNLDGAFSPDGESVVYSTNQGEIFIARRDGTEPRKLAAAGPFPASFQWSPNGRVIRFNRGGLLWEIASDGSGLHPLLSEWHEPGVQCCGSWTPDGQFYFFILQSRSTGSQIWALDEQRGLFRRPPSLPVRLTTGPIIWGDPRSSRDGKKIFADGRTSRGELSRIDPKTGGLQPFLGGISAEFVSYSNDGKSLAYVSFPEGVLWKADRDGSNRMQLSQPPVHVVNPRWSPDSKQILFTDLHEETLEIFVIPAEGGRARRLLPEEAARNGDPYWSPDGTRVVYSWQRLPTRELKLRILDVSSGRIETIPGSTGFFSPRWSSDGGYIAGLDRKASNLQVFDLKTQRWTELTANGDVQFPSFSQDGRFIYFLHTGREQGVFRIPVTGGKPEQVADLGEWHLTGLVGFSMSLDPTDAPLVLRDVGSDDIYALTLEEK
jgi:Tol biopolymer transport system component